MNTIEHLIEPNRLWVVWQPPLSSETKRIRRIVAEIVRNNSDQQHPFTFRYLRDSEDYQAASEEGFQGYPAFKKSELEHNQGVLEAFIRRLPPRKREDFKEYLAMYRLPTNFSGSDMALLGYTGAKLPSDSFELVPDFSDLAPPLEFMLEVAGVRHQTLAISHLHENDTVQFVQEPHNAFDSNAVAVMHNNDRIGYIGRPLLAVFNYWLEQKQVSATIERLNGKPERPMVYIFARIR